MGSLPKRAVLGTQSAFGRALGRRAPDLKYAGTYIGQKDGHMASFNGATTDISKVSPVMPTSGHANGQILYDNGINTPAANASPQMERLANQTGKSVGTFPPDLLILPGRLFCV
jgi:hypothetical protein